MTAEIWNREWDIKPNLDLHAEKFQIFQKIDIRHFAIESPDEFLKNTHNRQTTTEPNQQAKSVHDNWQSPLYNGLNQYGFNRYMKVEMFI